MYDIFLAYAGPDKECALGLHSMLSVSYRVFLDSKVLSPGDRWMEEVAKAQAQSLLTVVLVTPQSESSYFQQEEVLQAIKLCRAKGRKHRVVPVYLGLEEVPEFIPYGLQQLHGIFAAEGTTLLSVATMIEAALKLSKRQEQYAHHREGRTAAEKTSMEISPEAQRSLNARVRAVRSAEVKVEAISGLRKHFLLPNLSPELASLIYIDLDDFTVINRRFGESIGDMIADFVMGLLDKHHVYRWGGDEFILFLPEVEIVEGLKLARKLRRKIANHSWHALAPGLRVTASIGVAELKEDENVEDWLIRAICGADEAKRKGKNRVTRAPLALPLDMSRDLYGYGSD